MLFSIPLTKLDKLSKIIKRYQNKGALINFRKGEKTIENGTLHFSNSQFHISGTCPIKVECIQVEVEGNYIINGWRFLGTVEFTPNGNIIRLVDSSFEGKIPEKYMHTPRICEHCGTIRNRKDTYLIYNEEKGEYKQVGSSCLLEYTKGLDAKECASIMSCLDKFMELSDRDFSDDVFSTYNSFNYGLDALRVKQYAIALVKAYGYSKTNNGCGGTAADLSNALFRDEFDDLTPASEDEVKLYNDFAESISDSQFGYMRNAKLAWLKPYIEIRDFSLICSFVNTCLKQTGKQKALTQDKSNVFVGQIGAKITIKVASDRILYTKDNSAYSYYADVSYVHEIIDTEGHTFKWSTQNNAIEAGSTITATVKSYEDYRGKKQTVITRGRIN